MQAFRYYVDSVCSNFAVSLRGEYYTENADAGLYVSITNPNPTYAILFQLTYLFCAHES